MEAEELSELSTEEQIKKVELKWKCRAAGYAGAGPAFFAGLHRTDGVRMPDFVAGIMYSALIFLFIVSTILWLQYIRKYKEVLWF